MPARSPQPDVASAGRPAAGVALRAGVDGPPPFLEHLRDALGDLRATLLEVLTVVGGDPARPQDLARAFGLNKNLTWKISKIVGSDELLSVVPHVPGKAGVDIFLRAMRKAGAPDALVDRAGRAARTYEDVVRLHTDDRSTLEVMVDAALPSPQQTEQVRRMAFQGNSAIWGVRARAQLAMHVMMPGRDDPAQVDLAQVGGLVGFRRLRADTRWLLWRRERWSDAEPRPGVDETERLDDGDGPVAGEDGVPVLRRFCSRPLPEFRVTRAPGEDQYELPAGPIGNTAALTVVYGEVSRRVGSIDAEHPGDASELGTSVITPCEHLLLDVLVHRDFAWAMRPELLVHGRLDGGGMHHAERRSRNVLPVPERPMDLGTGLAGLATPVHPRHVELAGFVLDRLGHDPAEFRAFRVAMAYPPMPVVAMVRLPLRGSD